MRVNNINLISFQRNSRIKKKITKRLEENHQLNPQNAQKPMQITQLPAFVLTQMSEIKSKSQEIEAQAESLIKTAQKLEARFLSEKHKAQNHFDLGMKIYEESNEHYLDLQNLPFQTTLYKNGKKLRSYTMDKEYGIKTPVKMLEYFDDGKTVKKEIEFIDGEIRTITLYSKDSSINNIYKYNTTQKGEVFVEEAYIKPSVEQNGTFKASKVYKWTIGFDYRWKELMLDSVIIDYAKKPNSTETSKEVFEFYQGEINNYKKDYKKQKALRSAKEIIVWSYKKPFWYIKNYKKANDARKIDEIYTFEDDGRIFTYDKGYQSKKDKKITKYDEEYMWESGALSSWTKNSTTEITDESAVSNSEKTYKFDKNGRLISY